MIETTEDITRSYIYLSISTLTHYFAIGATSGIGQGLVESFVKQGAKVVFCGRREEKGKSVADATGASFVQADVLEAAELREVFATAFSTYGHVDVVVANAGTEGPHAVKILSEEFLSTYDTVMDVNLKSVVVTCQVGAEYLEKSGGGTILIMSSVNSSIAVPGFGAYCMSKAGCDALVRCLEAETDDSIHVYSINPYLIESEMTERLCSTFNVPDVKAWAQGTNPSGKVGSPQDIADLISGVLDGRYENKFPPGSSLLTDGHVLFHAREAIPLGEIKGTPEFDDKIKEASIR
jgi:NAD(P)-dependent dehydrogenase (short-subunit alcohol dehydrogenase family)